MIKRLLFAGFFYTDLDARPFMDIRHRNHGRHLCAGGDTDSDGPEGRGTEARAGGIPPFHTFWRHL